MRAEPHTTGVAGSARSVCGRLNRFGSARSGILVVSSSRPAAGHEATSTLRLLLIELDARMHTDARQLATSIPYGIDTAVQSRIAPGTSVTGHCAITARSSITSPAHHLPIGPDQHRPDGPARQPRRLTYRQLTLAA